MLIRDKILLPAAAVLLSSYVPLGFTQSESTAAAGPADTGLEEVVITAQKRTEKLEDVAVSAQVVGADLLETDNVADISDINKLSPSVQLNGTINGRVPMGMRGIDSVSNEQAVGVPSGVAILIDGVPVPSDSYDGNALEDVQSVEILKGPQSTLGGRTAAAGMLNLTTYGPTDHEVAGFSATATTDREDRGNFHISGPINDMLEYSVSGYGAYRVLPITNTYYNTETTQNDYGLRAKLKVIFSDNFNAQLTYHYAEQQSQGFNFVYLYLTPGTNLLFSPGPPFLSQAALLPGITPSWTNLDYNSPVTQAGAFHTDHDFNLDLNWNLGGGYTLASTTAYQHEEQQQTQDLFAVGAYFFEELTGGAVGLNIFNNTQTQFEHVRQLSEELKLVSPADQTFSYVVGLFYSGTSVDEVYLRGLPPAAVNLNVDPDTKTYDIYARSTWKITPSTSLVTGLRYNYDQLSYTYDQVIYNGQGPWYDSGSSNSSAVVGDISLQQQLTPTVMAYATYARGYSPQVYNTAATLTGNGNQLVPVGQEHINHFEIGAKGTYFDNHLELNMALFDTKYINFQVQDYASVVGEISPPLNLVGAGGAETKGVEVDVKAQPLRSLRVGLNLAYIDAKFTSWPNAPCEPDALLNTLPSNCTWLNGVVNGTAVQNMSGNPMANAPKFKGIASIEERLPVSSGSSLEWVVGADYTYRTSAEMLPDNNPEAVQGAFGILNVNVGLHSQDEKWTLTAFCDNVFDRVYYVDVEDFWSGPWSNTNALVGEPARDAQVYGGLRFSKSF